MLGENKNLKDSNREPQKDMFHISDPYENRGLSLTSSYTKTNKLISALYMVTDIMDKDEPLRNKLRNLGAGIVSDIHSGSLSASNRISEIMSFLDIASTINLISEMNSSILKKEFLQLQQSIQEANKSLGLFGGKTTLSDFLANDERPFSSVISSSEKMPINDYKGHSTRVGVQRGSTLMKALNDIKMSHRNLNNTSPKKLGHILPQAEGFRLGFDLLKRQRRDEILKIIKGKDGATITDIKNLAAGVLKSCGEKTLQRELVSMVSDGVLYKTGEKRWSRYFLK